MHIAERNSWLCTLANPVDVIDPVNFFSPFSMYGVRTRVTVQSCCIVGWVVNVSTTLQNSRSLDHCDYPKPGSERRN